MLLVISSTGHECYRYMEGNVFSCFLWGPLLYSYSSSSTTGDTRYHTQVIFSINSRVGANTTRCILGKFLTKSFDTPPPLSALTTTAAAVVLLSCCGVTELFETSKNQGVWHHLASCLSPAVGTQNKTTKTTIIVIKTLPGINLHDVWILMIPHYTAAAFEPIKNYGASTAEGGWRKPKQKIIIIIIKNDDRQNTHTHKQTDCCTGTG